MSKSKELSLVLESPFFEWINGLVDCNVVVVGLVFQQQESVKSELIEQSFIGSYSSRRLLISKWSTM